MLKIYINCAIIEKRTFYSTEQRYGSSYGGPKNVEDSMKKRVFRYQLSIIIFAVFVAAFLVACQNNSESSETVSENQMELSNISIDMDSLTGSGYESKTESPVIVEYRTVSDGRAVFSGTCEEGAEVYAFVDGNAVLKTGSHHGSFLFELYFNSGDSPMTVSICAKSEEKALSDAVEKKSYYRCNDDGGLSEWVWVGDDYQLFFNATEENYYRNDRLDNEDSSFVKQRFSERVEWLDENLNATPIYILVPNPNEIYGERMPDYLEERPDSLSLHEQTAELLTEAGAVVIDMKPILEQHKNDEFYIYHHTDSHWTEYAAYFAYTELFNYIAQEYSESTPKPFEDFGFANESHYAGDLYFDLGMDETLLYEMSTFSNINFETPVGFTKYRSEEATKIADEPTKEHTFVNTDGENKPNVVLMRDSYSIMMFDFIAERCATTTMLAMWDFNFDTERFTALDVDYVIYIICDMNLKNLYK